MISLMAVFDILTLLRRPFGFQVMNSAFFAVYDPKNRFSACSRAYWRARVRYG